MHDGLSNVVPEDTLWQTKITMENHHFYRLNQLYMAIYGHFQ